MGAILLAEIGRLVQEKGRAVLAIDGRCGSGKTTLGAYLQGKLGCPLIHMDDFYLRKEQRSTARRREPGGNVDYERFLLEVLTPLAAGKDFSYRPYDCATWSMKAPVEVKNGETAIVEGSYSCHPTLSPLYDLRVFLTVDPQTQMERIRRRNGEEKAKVFRDLWIPLEELYFKNVPVEKSCDFRFETGTDS